MIAFYNRDSVSCEAGTKFLNIISHFKRLRQLLRHLDILDFVCSNVARDRRWWWGKTGQLGWRR